MINVEELNDEELKDLREKFVQLAQTAREKGTPSGGNSPETEASY
jgi:hypothetical protein